jgi:hypothetical protein
MDLHSDAGQKLAIRNLYELQILTQLTNEIYDPNKWTQLPAN